MPAMPGKWVSVLFAIGGTAIALTAIFASRLGIDPSAGWGLSRVMLLIVGLGIALGGPLAWHHWERRGRAGDRLPDLVRTRRVVNQLALPDKLREYGVAMLVFTLVVIIYIWFVSSGTWTAWVSPTRYYADLARGFQQGKLFLPIRVDPALLTSSDPYDPSTNGATQAPLDVSYYHEKYYLPWGPVPALIVLTFRVLLHLWLGDLQLTFAFLCGVFLVQGCMLLTIRETYFRGQPKWLLWLGLLLTGLAGPMTFMLGNYKSARIYEAAVAGGQFFMMAGLLMAWIALVRSWFRWALVSAGMLWALAIGARADLILPIGVMVLMVSGWILRANGWSLRTGEILAFLYAPLLLGGTLLGWYNWARFGSVFETGYYYQLAGLNLHEHWNDRFSAGFTLQNLYTYILHPASVTANFPFLEATEASRLAAVPFAARPHFYFSQRTTGILWLMPFSIFAIVAVRTALVGVGRKQANQPAISNSNRDLLDWLALTLGGACLITFVLLLEYFWAAMRFLEDFAPSLMLLSILGFWQGYDNVVKKPVWKTVCTICTVVLAAAGIAVSLLVGIADNNGRFALVQLLRFLQ